MYGPRVDPRTFLPARRLALGALPEPGKPAPPLPIELEAGRPVVVAFLRHTGCPFAEATLRALRQAGEEAPDAQWLAIGHATEQATAEWSEAVGGGGPVRLVSDPDRHTYAAWGLGQTTVAHFLGRRSLTAVAGLARQGIRNRHPHGTRWQSAGTFALSDDGVVRWRHVPSHAGDLPDLSAALAAIR